MIKNNPPAINVSPIPSIFQTMPSVSFPLSLKARNMRLAQELEVFWGLGAHSLQTMTRIELGNIASQKKR